MKFTCVGRGATFTERLDANATVLQETVDIGIHHAYVSDAADSGRGDRGVAKCWMSRSAITAGAEQDNWVSRASATAAIHAFAGLLYQDITEAGFWPLQLWGIFEDALCEAGVVEEDALVAVSGQNYLDTSSASFVQGERIVASAIEDYAAAGTAVVLYGM